MKAQAMTDAYVTLWAGERCRRVQRDDDRGPLTVLFGGPHVSLPSVRHLKPGDRIYPVALRHGRLYLIGRVQVARVVPIEEYRTSHPWSSPGHQAQDGCIDHAVIGTCGSPIAFDLEIPPAVVGVLRFGPKPGREQPLRHVENGLLRHAISLQGHYRRLSVESAALLEGLMSARYGQPASEREFSY